METAKIKSPAGQQGKNLNHLIVNNNDSTKTNENQVKNDDKNNNVVNLFELYENYRLPNGYIIDNNDLARKVLVEIRFGGKDKVVKEEIQTICKAFVVDKIIKQEENTILSIKFKNSEIIAPAEIIADAKKLAEVFCRNNVIITAKTAKILTEYISEFLKLNEKKINIIVEKNETGWSDNGEIFYMPTTAQNTLFTNNIADSIYTKGEKEKEVKLIKEIFQQHTGASVIILIGLLNQLIKILSLQNYIIITSGRTGTGKTLASKIMLSIFGNPDLMMSNLNMTLNSIELKMSAFKDLPNLLDELETSAKTSEQIYNNIIHLIYNFASGQGRSRLNKNLTQQKVNKYRSFLFLTSERSIESILNNNTSDKANLGIIRRTIEINTDRIKLFNSDKVNYGEIANNINQNFGYVGPDWVKYVQNNYDNIEWDYISLNKKDNKIDILEFLKTIYKYFIEMLEIKENIEIINTINQIIQDNEKIYDENITNEEDKFKDYLNEFLVLNYNYMFDKIEEMKAKNDNRTYKIAGNKILGQINGDNEEYTHYLTSEFVNELCKKYKIDKNNFIQYIKEKEIFKVYKNVKINRQVTKAYCVKI
jgi:hypothetical protein